MRFIRQLSNREKIILSFLVLLVLLNGLTILVSRNLSGISDSFKSMLDDRLVPSSYLSEMQEGFYQNHLLLKEMIYLSGQADGERIRQIQEKNRKIDQVTSKFSATYLTSEEAEVLEGFNHRVKEYRDLEQHIIRLIENGHAEDGRDLYLQQSLAAFENLLSPMHELGNIQLLVGEDLYDQAGQTVSTIQLIAYLSLGIALMITIYMLKVLHFKVK